MPEIQEMQKGRNSTQMNYLLKKYPLASLKEGEIMEGTILTQEKGRLFVELGLLGTGVVFERELSAAKNSIKKGALKPGEKIFIKILNPEDDEGYAELSLKKTDSDTIWEKAKELMENQTPLELKVIEANKGGLIFNWNNQSGFLPTSQLKNEHYPKIENGDKDRILQELKKFIGITLKVIIIDADEDQKKLIFSEKELDSEEISKKISKYKIGDVIEGEVSGVAPFGVFIKIEPGVEALSHISELDWGLVEDPASLFKINEKIKAKIIQIDKKKIFLSIKALKPDPWQEAENKYKEGDTVSGEVSKLDKYGALITLAEGIAGLLPVKEIDSEDSPKEKMELGKTYSFKIASFEPKKQKLILKLED